MNIKDNELKEISDLDNKNSSKSYKDELKKLKEESEKMDEA